MFECPKEDEEAKEANYTIFNESGDQKEFNIELCGHNLVIDQDPSQQHSHGFIVWESAVIVTKYLETDPKNFRERDLRDKKVLELGSGTGLAGLSFLLRKACVTFTDTADVIQLTTQNAFKTYNKVKRMGSYHEPIVQVLDWTAPEAEQNIVLQEKPYDYVLLTDCVFSELLAKPLVATILRACSKSTIVLCCHEIRDEDANNAFITEFSNFFKIKKISPKQLDKKYRNEMCEVFTGKLTR